MDACKKVDHLSRGERVQVALIGALCPEPDLLILDEPTSGLDPLIRREFIRTVIGAYQSSDPENRTVFVSTHLISEFEGLIDEFTIIDKGRAILTATSEDARSRYTRLRCRFPTAPPSIEHSAIVQSLGEGRERELTVDGELAEVQALIQTHQPAEIIEESLTLEEIFLVNARAGGNGHVVAS